MATSCPNCGTTAKKISGSDVSHLACPACNLAVDPDAAEAEAPVNVITGGAEVDEEGHYLRPEDDVEVDKAILKAYPEVETVEAAPGTAPEQPEHVLADEDDGA
jgi:hypothetical protein